MKKLISICLVLILAIGTLSACNLSDTADEPTEELEFHLLDDGTYGVSAGNAKDFEKIVIPASVTYIDRFAFYGCTSLKSVEFKGQELLSIGDFAFLECTSLETITLPEGLEEIGNQTFGNCKSIKSIKAPSTLKTIGTLTFYGCEGLNAPGALTLSASIEEIGEFAFTTISKQNIVAPKDSYAAEYVAKMAEDEAEK
jgi:hypothetical protein